MKKLTLLTLSTLFLISTLAADFSWKSKIVNKDARKGKVQSEVVMKYRASKGKIRIDFEKLKGNNKQGYQKNTYWIFKNNTIYIVNDKQKTVMPMSIDAALQMSAMAGKIVKIRIEDHKINKKVLAPQAVAGIKCKHIKLKKQYKMKMKIAIIKKQMNMESDQELWLSSNVPMKKDLSSAFLKKDYKTGFKDLDKMIEKEMAAYGKHGFIMKSIEKTTTKNKKGKVKGVVLTTTTISDIRRENFKSSIFEVPKNYETYQMGPSESDKKKKKKKKKKFGLF